mmetsp:Transcript_92003/g.265454  ORF Transcript_92003/g.265454 Transcript_92003/m.265454 type:complete len:207 (+) Transcript_92003:1465-2085(+)
MSSFNARGSKTLPERMWAPISAPFSTTQTLNSLPASFATCFALMAAPRPAGPPPMISTSNSICSRSTASALKGRACARNDGLGITCRCPRRWRKEDTATGVPGKRPTAATAIVRTAPLRHPGGCAACRTTAEAATAPPRCAMRLNIASSKVSGAGTLKGGRSRSGRGGRRRRRRLLHLWFFHLWLLRLDGGGCLSEAAAVSRCLLS